MAQKFAHHHLHTEFSPLDSMISVKKLVSQAKELGYETLTVTDHGTLCGWIKFYKACKAGGIKPILGLEAYYCKDRHHHKLIDGRRGTRHLILIAKNNIGYRNLCEISEISYREGYYYNPRMDWDLLSNKGLGEGLIATSACVAGEIPQAIRRGDMKAAEEEALRFKELFGKDFYIEIMHHQIEVQDAYIDEIQKLAKRLDIPILGTNDVHYLHKGDYDAHAVMVAANTRSNIHAKNRLEFETNEYYLKSPDEMAEVFRECPEAVESALEIADKCNVEIELDSSKIKLPKFDIPENVECANEYQYLRKLTFTGLEGRGFGGNEEYIERINYELGVIDHNGFSRYFLMVWDYIDFAKRSGIRTGPGRGSCVGSLVCYCLQITDINPMEHGLLFERFLNEERISPPDIDTDFDFFRRQEIYDYIIEKYGQDNVGNIGTHQTFKAKNALRSVIKAMDPMKDYQYNYEHGYKKGHKDYKNESLELENRIAAAVPETLNVTIKESLEKSAELRAWQEKYPTVFNNAMKIEGLSSTPSIHAAGIVVAPEPLCRIAPLHLSRDNLCTQFPNEDLEDLGLVKFDILALKTLSQIDMALRLIKEKYDIDIEINKLVRNDEKTLQMLAAGQTLGVFQLESDGMRRLLKGIRVDRFEDIVAANALYRPGALADQAHERYCNRKHGRENIDYIHDNLKPVTSETYGCLVYQEQLMQATRELAGFSRGESDMLRKAISKKKGELFENLKRKFVEGCIKNQIPAGTIKKIWKTFEGYGGYGFNKSHSVAYAELAYQTAYLKAHYPMEWMLSILSLEARDKKHESIIKYWREIKHIGFKTLKACVNNSGVNYEEENGSIRESMLAIKGVGVEPARSIEKLRKQKSFVDFYDFCNRIDSTLINSKTVEFMIEYGALDCFKTREYNRDWMIANYKEIMSSIKKSKSKSSQKESMFDSLDFNFNPFAKTKGSKQKERKVKQQKETPIEDDIMRKKVDPDIFS